MANVSCSACEDLRQTDPNLIVNGFTDTECTSLQNDTGLSPSSGHDDCTDLNNLNDCLVGNEATEVESYDVCDWKTFMKKFIPNVWTVLKGIICAICGLWTNIHSIWEKIAELIAHINAVSYVGILTLYRTSQLIDTSNASKQALAFNTNVRQGNIASSVLTVASDYKGIVVNNTTSVPLLVNTDFNCSIRTDQHMASCYIVVTRDGATIGQTPFITPSTYDQQVNGETFILNPGQSATLRYYFGIGDANDDTWFQDLFWKSGHSEDAHMCLEWNDPNNPENQGSYFKVTVTSVVAQES